MDLLNRYVQAVRFWLPSAQQDDIVAELSEDIRSEIEERETGLGRKLTDNEVEEILKQRGRPLLVAEKYLPQTFLIGPVLFPAYKFVLKLALACWLIPWAGVWIALMVLNPSYRAHHSGAGIPGDLYALWLNALSAFAAVTILFAVLERFKDRSGFLNQWSPRQLPPVRDVQRISRFGAAVELVVGVFFGAWWLKLLWALTLFEADGVKLALAPVWRQFFWAFVVVWLINTALSAANFVRPYWTAFRRGVRATSNFATAGILTLLAKAHATVIFTGPTVPSGKIAEIAQVLDWSLQIAFLAAGLGLIIAGFVEVWRMSTSSRKQIRLNHGMA
jgi:hypothetical protein